MHNAKHLGGQVQQINSQVVPVSWGEVLRVGIKGGTRNREWEMWKWEIWKCGNEEMWKSRTL